MSMQARYTFNIILYMYERPNTIRYLYAEQFHTSKICPHEICMYVLTVEIFFSEHQKYYSAYIYIQVPIIKGNGFLRCTVRFKKNLLLYAIDFTRFCNVLVTNIKYYIAENNLLHNARTLLKVVAVIWIAVWCTRIDTVSSIKTLHVTQRIVRIYTVQQQNNTVT